MCASQNLISYLTQVIATRKIEKGEEITAAYGHGYANFLRSQIEKQAANDKIIETQQRQEFEGFVKTVPR